MNLLRWIKRMFGIKDEPFSIGPPRYRYVPGMERPDPRYHTMSGDEARRRETAARAALRGELHQSVSESWAQRRRA